MHNSQKNGKDAQCRMTTNTNKSLMSRPRLSQSLNKTKWPNQWQRDRCISTMDSTSYEARKSTTTCGSGDALLRLLLSFTSYWRTHPQGPKFFLMAQKKDFRIIRAGHQGSQHRKPRSWELQINSDFLRHCIFVNHYWVRKLYQQDFKTIKDSQTSLMLGVVYSLYLTQICPKYY